MKFTGILVGALAAVAAAAPTEKRGQSINASQFGNFQAFGQNDLNYFLSVNSLDLALFEQLATQQNFNIGFFSSLFNTNSQDFQLQQLLLIQQLLTFQSLANVGLFSNFDLSGLNLNAFNFGLLDSNIGGLGLSQFIQSSQIPQIAAVVQTLNIV